MVVGQAAKMAPLMTIPIIVLVENMSYIECPDCGKKISVFGESHLDETAFEYGIDHTARLPIDPVLAAGCDSGEIEKFDGNWLDGIADVIEKIEK